MTKKVKRVISAIVSFALMLTVLATPLGDVVGVTKDSVGTTASAAQIDKTSVLTKIEEIKALFPSGSYFSVNGKACTHGRFSSCSNCKLETIMKSNSKVSNTIVPSVCSRGGCYTCVAFARFAYCYIFGHDSNTNVITMMSSDNGGICDAFVSKLRPGDYLACYNSEGKFTHAAIFLSCDLQNDKIYVYDSNVGTPNKVNYSSSRSYTDYSKIEAVRSKNYVDSVNITTTPSDIGSSFTSTIKCTSTGKFLTVDSNNNVVALSSDNSNKQKWKFTKNSDNYYEIENVATGLRLDVYNAGDEKGTNIQGYKDNDSPAQRWGIYGSQGSYVLKPKYSSTLVLDSDGGNNNVHLWTYYSNVAAQKFTIIPDPAVKFDTYSVTNLTSTGALVKCKAYKPASAKAIRYGICYAPSSKWGIFNLLDRKYFYSTASISNVGNTSRNISFDFDIEMKVKLTPNTEYKYYFIGEYDFGNGETRTYTSDTKSFVTKTSSNQTHTHSYSSSITKSATCTSAGVRTYKCSCGASYTESIAALGHSYGSWSTATSATCTSGGTEKRTCSRCGNSETRSTSALGHSYGSTYYEAAHPHYYAHMCSRCGYKEYTGGNLSYYEKCDTCRNNNAPNKAEFINLNSSYKEGSEIVFDWTTTDKTTHYNLLLYKQNEEGEYDIINRIDYATQGSTVNNFYAGNYRVLIQSYNSNYFFTNSSGWRDWIHTESDYAYFSVQHNYVAYVINPTLAAEGYTLHECSVCGDSYKDNYTAKLLPAEKVTGLAYESRISDSITLKWNKSENADGYIVEYLSGDRFVKLADKTSGSTVSHIATGLEPGTLYKFRIRAYRNVNGARAYAAYSDVLCVRTLPAAMSGFALGARTDTTITLKWNKNESANGYVIEKYNGTKWVTLATKTSNTAVSHKVTGLQASTVYKFRVRSYIKDEEGRIYGEYTSTLSACTNPSVVEGLTLGGRASNALRLNWTENTSADGYIIEKYNGTSWSRIAKITSNATTTYRVTGLSAGTTYKFRIKAYKMSGSTALYSGYTATLSACTKPSNLIGIEIGGVASTALRVNWTQNTSADGYIVEIYKGGAWVRVAKITNNTTVTYRISGLAKNTTYKIRMKAYKMSGSTALYSGYTTISGKTNT